MASQKRAHTKTQATSTARTSRLTENKRRYRARRKEYVSDLEQRLTEAREQGIQATKEMQLASRRVVLENNRLRELLQLAGFDNEDLDVWAKHGSCEDSGNDSNCARKRQVEQKAKGCAAFTTSHHRMAVEATRIPSSENPGKTTMSEVGNMSERTDVPHITQEPLGSSSRSSSPSDPTTSIAACSTPATSEDAPTTQVEGRTGCGKQMPPCKLLSRLAENPGTDVTQVTVPPAPFTLQGAADHEGGVECGKAYEMLMRYATSEARIDKVASALEGGCTSNGKGGCAVDKRVVWQVLDDMCG